MKFNKSRFKYEPGNDKEGDITKVLREDIGGASNQIGCQRCWKNTISIKSWSFKWVPEFWKEYLNPESTMEGGRLICGSSLKKMEVAKDCDSWK